MPHRVRLTETAFRDLQSISDYLADVAGEDVAATHDAQLKAACSSLTDFPRRGRLRDEIYPGLRSISFARFVTIFYAVGTDDVKIIRVIHSRRDTSAAFEEE